VSFRDDSVKLPRRFDADHVVVCAAQDRASLPKKVETKVKSSKVRVVDAREIFLALLFASTDRYTNPHEDVSEDELAAKGGGLVEEEEEPEQGRVEPVRAGPSYQDSGATTVCLGQSAGGDTQAMDDDEQM
jgi:hypothetical protein